MTKNTPSPYQAVVIGCSSGCFQALLKVLSPLPKDFAVPIIVVRHQKPDSSNYLIQALEEETNLAIRYAKDGQIPRAGYVYIAPPDQHLRVNQQGKLILNNDDKVNFSRPSLDPLFLSAADYYQQQLIAVVLTGANDDGVSGVKKVKQNGGTLIVQDPESAKEPTMPKAAIKAAKPNHITWLDQIGPQLWTLTRTKDH